MSHWHRCNPEVPDGQGPFEWLRELEGGAGKPHPTLYGKDTKPTCNISWSMAEDPKYSRVCGEEADYYIYPKGSKYLKVCEFCAGSDYFNDMRKQEINPAKEKGVRGEGDSKG